MLWWLLLENDSTVNITTTVTLLQHPPHQLLWTTYILYICPVISFIEHHHSHNNKCNKAIPKQLQQRHISYIFIHLAFQT